MRRPGPGSEEGLREARSLKWAGADEPASKLARLASLDGRWVLVVVLTAYFGSIGWGAAREGYAWAWARFGVDPMYVVPGQPQSGTVPFGDAHNLLAAIDCSREGFDVTRENPCDVHGRPHVYSRAWLILRHLPLSRDSVIPVGIGVGLSFLYTFFVFVGRIDLGAGIVYAVLLCSPSIMLGVERGNTDLVAFQLVAWPLLLLSRGMSGVGAYGLILVAALLKFFPIAALATVLRETRSRALALLAAFGSIWLTFVAYFSEEILSSRGTHVSKIPRSYGALVLRDAVLERLEISGWVPANWLAPALLLAIAGIAIAAVATGLFRARAAGIPPHLDSFRAGAALFAMTYFMPVTNWDYKLVFSLPMLPQILHWTKEREPMGFASKVALVTLAVTLWLSREHHAFLKGEILNLALLAYSLHLLAWTRPVWMSRTGKSEK